MQKPWLNLKNMDREVHDLIEEELKRQQTGLELIASENFASQEVVAAMGNIFTNKYAEGRPHKRYYGGCHVVDKLEDLAIDRLTRLFNCKFANVQPHSGAQANSSVFLALLEGGDKILGLDLTHGGHLTHGSKVNFSGKLYESHFYQLDEDTGRINMDHVFEVAHKVKPKLIIAGASSYPRTIDFESFRNVADSVGAYLMVDMAHIAGLVAAGVHPSPFPHAHVVTSTTHKTLRGPRGGIILWNDEDLTVKINKGVFPGTQGGPLEHIIAAKAVCFKEALEPSFKGYQKKVVENARVLAESLQKLGFDLVSNGTDNHLVLLDLSKTEISGKQLEEELEKVSITTNKNTVPKESRSPFVTSGVRLGTPAITSRGMTTYEMPVIAKVIRDVFDGLVNKNLDTESLRSQVEGLAKQFPLYSGWQ